jgi:hypothetical protein
MEDQMMQITHYMPMRSAMDMQKQIIDIELALARARKAAKTERGKLALYPEDQACYKAKTQEYTARKDPEIEFRERERPKKADEPTECGENSIEVSNPRDLDATWRWLSGDDTTSKKRRKKRKNHDGKGKTAEVKAENETFDGYCTGCKKYGHKQHDCWAKAPGNTARVDKAEETVPDTMRSPHDGDSEEYDYDKPTLAETNSASYHYGYGSGKSTLAEAESASDYGHGSDRPILAEANSA